MIAVLGAVRLGFYIDHTLLNATATKTDIIKLCDEAKEHKFFSVLSLFQDFHKLKLDERLSQKHVLSEGTFKEQWVINIIDINNGDIDIENNEMN